MFFLITLQNNNFLPNYHFKNYKKPDLFNIKIKNLLQLNQLQLPDITKRKVDTRFHWSGRFSNPMFPIGLQITFHNEQ